MNRKEKIHKLLNEAADEILAFIKESESGYQDHWMPAADIKNRLGLMLPAVPQANEQQGKKGWLFATLMRILEDKSLVEWEKEANNRTFYRSR
jgi:hypothetical protein